MVIWPVQTFQCSRFWQYRKQICLKIQLDMTVHEKYSLVVQGLDSIVVGDRKGIMAIFSLDWMPNSCFLGVLQARCIASVSAGRRDKSGTGDSKSQVGLFKLWYILFHCWHFYLALKRSVILHIQLKRSKQFCFCILRTKTLEMDESQQVI